MVVRVACSKNVRSQQSETGWRELTEWAEVRVDLRQEKRAEYVEKNATQGRQVEVRGESACRPLPAAGRNPMMSRSSTSIRRISNSGPSRTAARAGGPMPHRPTSGREKIRLTGNKHGGAVFGRLFTIFFRPVRDISYRVVA
ncbi:hypothetical protein LV563_14630 (plasmid) [Novacetimonas hansenii]|nr:hypothetical protein [Novacetimonas hansenii]WEQ60608.1 hypothetical protein LV563_14630 [Novacetimonas hansenii]